jgi:DnaK suppressor protein
MGGEMNQTELLHYQNLLLSKRQELSNARSRPGADSTASDHHGDPLDVAASETRVATQIRLHETDGKLLRAIDDALTRIRREKFGVCEECGNPISAARLQAVPWTRWCRDCKERQDSQG